MAGCGFDPVCIGTHGIQDVVGSVAGSVIDELAKAVEDAVGKIVASVGTLWVKVGTPNLTTSNGGSTPSDAVGFLQGSLWWYMAAAAVFSVILGGAKMAWEGRAEPGRDVLKGLLTLVVVSGAGLTAISLAVAAADSFANWIINSSLDGTSFGKNITVLLGLTAISGLGAIIVIILGLAAFVASLIQIALMVVRGGMLVILAGIFPLSASATSTEWGRTWFKKCLAWLVAFVLYKPAAAIVYATAFRLAGSDVFGGDDLMNAISGLVLMVLALVALPALMRFVTPMVGAMASGGGGGGGAMAMGAMAAMPTGAMKVPRGGGSSNGGGATAGAPGGPGPSGAQGTGGGRGPAGSNGASPPGGGSSNGGAPTPAATPAPTAGASPAAASGAGTGGGAAAGGRAAAGGGAAAGGAAAAGPAGAAAVAGAQAAKGAKDAAKGATESQSEGGPSGSS